MEEDATEQRAASPRIPLQIRQSSSSSCLRSDVAATPGMTRIVTNEGGAFLYNTTPPMVLPGLTIIGILTPLQDVLAACNQFSPGMLRDPAETSSAARTSCQMNMNHNLNSSQQSGTEQLAVAPQSGVPTTGKLPLNKISLVTNRAVSRRLPSSHNLKISSSGAEAGKRVRIVSRRTPYLNRQCTAKFGSAEDLIKHLKEAHLDYLHPKMFYTCNWPSGR